ncbi:MAG: class I SAM-dependent methyltransferase [Xanthomonadales bacterium]|jgi:SAM-dependent methyltransferase|nr:class I SAM-dependent methyltransferase [Xanthomonadales bacterium]
MYPLLADLAKKPEPFSVSTVKELWTRPHLAGEMLKYHLSQDSDHSSRPIATIEKIVAWIDGQLDLEGKRVVDLGCGPGLYARRMAKLGARVTGIDFSANSLEYARSRDMRNMEYIEADYLEDDLPGGFDIAVLIYYDFCAMAPDKRNRLLQKIRVMLNPGGHLVLDLYGPGAFDAVSEHLEIENRLMFGFFAPGDYIGIHKTDVYDDDWVSLDRFVVVEPGETWQIFNWAQYFTPERAVEELAAAGFMVSVMTGGLDGEPLADHSKSIGLIAEKR